MQDIEKCKSFGSLAGTTGVWHTKDLCGGKRSKVYRAWRKEQKRLADSGYEGEVAALDFWYSYDLHCVGGMLLQLMHQLVNDGRCYRPWSHNKNT